jgi:uncharacterized protein (DUF1778 family)
MPQPATDTGRSDRIELRTTPQEKALLARAAALEHLDLTSFVLRAAVPTAREVVARIEQVTLSERDTLRVLHLLEHPPRPSAKLAAAAKAWAANRKKVVGA